MLVVVSVLFIAIPTCVHVLSPKTAFDCSSSKITPASLYASTTRVWFWSIIILIPADSSTFVLWRIGWNVNADIVENESLFTQKLIPQSWVVELSVMKLKSSIFCIVFNWICPPTVCESMFTASPNFPVVAVNFCFDAPSSKVTPDALWPNEPAFENMSMFPSSIVFSCALSNVW